MTTPLPLPASLRYGRVTGRVIRGVGDTIADTDLLPEGALIPDLQVVFTPATPRIVASAEQTVVLPAPVMCTFDDQGFLVYNGERGVHLLATDVGNPAGWTWRAAFSGSSVVNWSFDFELPTDAVIDISTVAPIPTSSGTAIVRGDSAYDIAVANGYVGTQAQWLASLKGDPGAASMARGIFDGDLRALKNAADAGSYAIASSATNKPITGVGSLIVATNTGNAYVTHIFTSLSGLGTWTCYSLDGTAWSEWRRLDTFDSGWRDVSGLLPSTLVPAPSVGTCHLRRIGSEVLWRFRLGPAGALIGAPRSDRIDTGWALQPLGWRNLNNYAPPRGQIAAHLVTETSHVPMILAPWSTVNDFALFMAQGATTGTWKATDIIHGTVSWMTDDAEPTTLPGTPA